MYFKKLSLIFVILVCFSFNPKIYPAYIPLPNAEFIQKALKEGKATKEEIAHYVDGLIHINQHDIDGETILTWAVIYNQFPIVKLLLSKGADPEAGGQVSPMLSDAINEAFDRGFVEIFKELYQVLPLQRKYGWLKQSIKYYISEGTYLDQTATYKIILHMLSLQSGILDPDAFLPEQNSITSYDPCGGGYDIHISPDRKEQIRQILLNLNNLDNLEKAEYLRDLGLNIVNFKSNSAAKI